MDLKFISAENRARYFSRFYHRIRILGWVQVVFGMLIISATQLFSPIQQKPIIPAVILVLGVLLLIIPKNHFLELMTIFDLSFITIGLILTTLLQQRVTGVQWPMFLLAPSLAMLVLPRMNIALSIVALNSLGVMVIPPLRITQTLPANIPVSSEVVWLRWEAVLIAFVLLVMAVVLIGYEERKAFRNILRTLRIQSEASQALTRTLTEVFSSNHELEEQLERQHELRTFIENLGIPLITIHQHFALLTLNGPLDIEWLHRLNQDIPQVVYAQRYRGMVIDLTGAVLLDPESVNSLHQLIRKIELLGCRVGISGLSRKLARLLSRTNDSLIVERVVRLDQTLTRWFNPAKVQ